MYIEPWVFWLMIIIILCLIAQKVSDMHKLAKAVQMLKDAERAANNIVSRLISQAWDGASNSSPDELFELIVSALINGADSSVILSKSYLDTCDILSTYSFIKSVKPREKITLITAADSVEDSEDLEKNVRKDLSRWLGYKDKEKPAN